MTWNPDLYNQFKQERFLPFEDCINLITKKPSMDVIDLGCGTGELTRKLRDSLPEPQLVLGIDSSAEMLSKSHQFASQHLLFAQRSIEQQVSMPDTWDLVFSNAAIQWVPDHRQLLSSIIGMIRKGGQLVIQI
ncbi:MAG: methyltransferase domain-containing protein, partial [Sphingobacteriales bacterium]